MTEAERQFAMTQLLEGRDSLLRAIEGLSQKMLSQTLKALERDGLVARKAFATVPVTVEYSITPLGRTLASALASRPVRASRMWLALPSPRRS